MCALLIEFIRYEGCFVCVSRQKKKEKEENNKGWVGLVVGLVVFGFRGSGLSNKRKKHNESLSSRFGPTWPNGSWGPIWQVSRVEFRSNNISEQSREFS